jgi:4-hydroxyphenylpyruvate dioxygenase-like putative hemolysin
MPTELKIAAARGGDTTLMVWADVDNDMQDPARLRQAFWNEAQKQGISQEEFDQVVFVFARDRIENWIEFLNTGTTNEDLEGPRVSPKESATAARKLAEICLSNRKTKLPKSLEWSCKNWRALVKRMGT